MYLEKNSSSKIACMEQKARFPCIWYMKQYIRVMNIGLGLILFFFYFFFFSFYIILDLDKEVWSLLLSLLLPSYIVVSIRKLPDTLYSLKLQDNQQELSNYYSMGIEINLPREHSTSPSPNSFRGTFPISTIYSINYAEWVQVVFKNITWTKQVKNREVENLSLSHATMKEATNTASIEFVIEYYNFKILE